MNSIPLQNLSHVNRYEFLQAKEQDVVFGEQMQAHESWEKVVLRQAAEKAIFTSKSILAKHFDEEAVAEIWSDKDTNIRTAARLMVERDGVAIIFCLDFAQAFWRDEMGVDWRTRFAELVRVNNPVGYIQQYLAN